MVKIGDGCCKANEQTTVKAGSTLLAFVWRKRYYQGVIYFSHHPKTPSCIEAFLRNQLSSGLTWNIRMEFRAYIIL